MLKRAGGLLWHHDDPVPDETRQLEASGHCLLRGVFAGRELAELKADVLEVFARLPGDRRAGIADEATSAQFRYQMFNRSALSQQAMAHPRILAVVEPLVGSDCHAIRRSG